VFRFGPFELTPEAKELRKNGRLLRLSPQPFQVLLILLEKPGVLVTRDELGARLWGDSQSTVEFDAGVNRCIRQIRTALNDNSDFPHYVETIPRQGYRFIGALEGIEPAPQENIEAPEAPSIPPKIPPSNRWRRFLIPAAIAFLALALGAKWLLSNRPQHPVDLTTTPLAVALGDQYAPAFSPDGRQVAFAWNKDRGNKFDIYVKDIGSSSPPLRLTSNEGTNYSPAWSPDGNWIAFYSGSDERTGGIWLMRPLGGPARKLQETGSLVIPSRRDIAWSHDSRFLVVTRDSSHDHLSQILQINAETGETKTLLTAAKGEQYQSPCVSPDGAILAFTRDLGPGTSATMLLSLTSGGAPHLLRAQVAPHEEFHGILNRFPAWTPDGRYVVFSSDSGGRNHLWLAPVEGDGPLEELGALGGGAIEPSMSLNGELALVHEEYDTNIWRLDLHRAVSEPGPNPVEVVSSTMLEMSPAISPDGKRLAFASTQSGHMEIWTSDADGKNAAPLTSMKTSITGSPAWSPDGTRIAFDSRIEGRPHIYVIGANGGKPERLTPAGETGVVPHWSVEGTSVYYSSDSSGQMEIWRISSSGGAPERITKQGGFAGVPSTDGKLLYFAAGNGPVSSLWRLELSTNKTTLVAPSILSRGFAVSMNDLYYISSSSGADGYSLFLYDRRSNSAKLRSKLPQGVEFGISLSQDANSLYYTGVDRADHELLLVSHFWK
jgi:Tol biopolymer transport system component/DNA-binding winged helix-turn-helix (wHTH) protein